MTTACTETKYFSGQGALLLSDRDPVTGKPTGLMPVGNISALSLSVETSIFEHKESCSGTRGVDLEVIQEVNASMKMTMENLDADNLAFALYGTTADIATADITAEVVKASAGSWHPLEHIKVSSVVVNGPSGTPTYALDTDYLLNAEAGTIKIIEGGSISVDELLEVNYTHADQQGIEAITSGAAPIKYARFEGLNTADGDKPVIIDFFKLSVKPLAELALIQDEVAGMEVESKILSDALRSTGSKYFRIRKLA